MRLKLIRLNHQRPILISWMISYQIHWILRLRLNQLRVISNCPSLCQVSKKHLQDCKSHKLRLSSLRIIKILQAKVCKSHNKFQASSKKLDMRLWETHRKSGKVTWEESKTKRAMRGLTSTSSISLDNQIIKSRLLHLSIHLAPCIMWAKVQWQEARLFQTATLPRSML